MKYFVSTLFLGTVIVLGGFFSMKNEVPVEVTVIMNKKIVAKELEKAVLFREVRSLTAINSIGIEKQIQQKKGKKK